MSTLLRPPMTRTFAAQANLDAEFLRIVDSLTRRQLVGGALGLAAGGATLAGCSSDADEPGSAGGSPTADEPWTFIDDAKKTINKPKRPTRIVAFASMGAALIQAGIKPAGLFNWSPVKEDPNLAKLDYAGIPIVGEVFAEVNIEKLASLKPDLILTVFDSTDNTYYGVDAVQKKDIEAVAPVVGLDNTLPVLTQIARFREFIGALGGSIDSDVFTGGKATFDDLSGKIRAAAAGKKLRVMAISSTPDAMNVAQPQPNPDLTYFKSLGVDFVVPEGKGIFWWAPVSPEQFGRYPADVLLTDNRRGKTVIRDLEKHPTWKRLPAVAAGQVFPWHAYPPPMYGYYNAGLTDLLTAVQKSKRLA